MKVGLLASLGVGGQLFAYAGLVERLTATDALLLAAVLGAFVAALGVAVMAV